MDADTLQAEIPTAGTESQLHDTPGKGELAVTTERVQISGFNIDVRLGLCTPRVFSLPLRMMAFSCNAVSCQASCSSDMTINKYGFMLLSLPVAGFYDFFSYTLR